MIRSFFTVFLLIFCVLAKGQNSFTDGLSNNPGITVSLPKMNVLYIGVDNEVEISVPGKKPEDIVVDFEGEGSITKASDWHYVARVKTPGQCQILISQIIAGVKVPLQKAPFKIKQVPDPQATLGGMLRGGTASTEKILNMKSVVPMLLLFEYDVNFQVRSFSVSVVSNGKVKTAQTKGSVYSKEMKSLISDAKPGDLVFVKDIVVEWPDKSSKEINALVIQVE